jgi:hypothetical protein
MLVNDWARWPSAHLLQLNAESRYFCLCGVASRNLRWKSDHSPTDVVNTGDTVQLLVSHSDTGTGIFLYRSRATDKA